MQPKNKKSLRFYDGNNSIDVDVEGMDAGQYQELAT